MAEEKQMVVAGQQYEINCVCKNAEIIIKDTKCSGPRLYYCKPCEDTKKHTGNRYCNLCGPLLHQLFDHQFDVNSSDTVSINEILKTEQDDDEAGWGKKLLVALIGNEKFNKVKPYMETALSISGVGVSGYVLYAEVAQFMGENAGKIFVTKNVLKAGGVTMIIVSLAEMAVNGYRWYSGQISGKEWLRLTGKTIVRNVAAFGGMTAGAKIGALAGTALAPGVGTAIGLVSGAVLGLLCGIAAGKLYERCFPNGEEAARRDAVKEAVTYFHYQHKDIKNKKIFNKKELRRRFKLFALDAHPDRRDGDHSEWNILSQHYGILLGLCEESNTNKKVVQEVLAIEH
eukprot:182179_1